MSFLRDGAHAMSSPDLEARFEVAYDDLYPRVRRYVARLLGGGAQAEDITQDVLSRLWQEMRARREPRAERAWGFRAATNAAINASKSRQRGARLNLAVAAEQQRSAPWVDVERALMRREIVQRALGQVPDPMRQCLLLYHEGLTGKEIADVLGVAPSYVGTLVVRAPDRFRRACAAFGDLHDLLG